MYRFKATFTHFDEEGRWNYERLLIEIDLTPYDSEDFEGMDPECFACVQAVKKAYIYAKDKPFSFDKIEFISC